MERQIVRNSLDADLKVLALSDRMVAGRPRRATNLRKASRNFSTFSPCVSSKWMARVAAHVNKQIYALLLTVLLEDSTKYSGPAKSNPVWANGGSSDYRHGGRSGAHWGQ